MKLLVINLDRAPERLADTAKLFADAGLAFERVPAVDARAMSDAERRRTAPPVRFYLANARRVRPGEIACTLSHRKAWDAAFAGGAATAAVFEDDVWFEADGLKSLLAEAERGNDPAVPTVWLLHRGMPRPRRAPDGPWYDLLATRDVGRSWCAHAYALNAAAARRLGELLSPMATPCDAWSTFARRGVRVLVASEPCARTRGDDSTIPRPQNGLWRFRLVQKAYWLRYRLAFRLDLLLRKGFGR